MSIIFRKAETPLLEGKLSFTAERIQVEIDPVTKNQLNLPTNYEFRPVVLRKGYSRCSSELFNFKVREDDIWIAGFPKTGTTLIHNIAWQLANGLDFKSPTKKSIDELFEQHAIIPEPHENKKLLQYANTAVEKFNQFDELLSPRCFKTHLPAFLLPKDIWTVKPKIIYIARNPKDVIVSAYHMIRNNYSQYKGTIEELAEIIRNNQIFPTPFFDHMFSYWQLRNLDHVLFLKYEEYSADPFAGVKKISEFLGYSYDDKQLKQLTEYVSFDNLRKYDLENYSAEITGGKKVDEKYRHCRKGKVGGYRDDMSNELIEDLNKWLAEGMKEFDFEFAE